MRTFLQIFQSVEDEESIPAAVSILVSLLQYNGELRLALAADVKHMLILLRCKFMYLFYYRLSYVDFKHAYVYTH